MQAPCGARLRAWSFAHGDRPRCAASQRARLSLQSDAQCAACAAGEWRTPRAADGWRGAAPAVVRSGAPRQPYRDSARGHRRVASAEPGARLVSSGAGACHAERDCGAAGVAGCGSTEPDTGDQGSARAGARRNRRLPAGGTRRSSQRRRARPAPARGRVMGRRTDPCLSPAVHPEAGKRGQSGVRVQLCLHQPVARCAVAQSGAGAIGATTAGSWSRHRPHVGGRVANRVPCISRWPVVQRAVGDATRRRAVRRAGNTAARSAGVG